MTTEQKLKLFVQTVLVNVTHNKDSAVKEYEQQLISDLEKEKADLAHYLETSYHQKEAQAALETNRQISEELARLKQQLALTTTQAADTVFTEVTNQLQAYKKTAAYKDYLASLIQEITDYAGLEQVTIYMDPTDETLLSELSQQTDAALKIADQSFLGGLQAIIPEKNLFVDESFDSKLNEARDTFVLQ